MEVNEMDSLLEWEDVAQPIVLDPDEDDEDDDLDLRI
jgi:hypothetical protein